MISHNNVKNFLLGVVDLLGDGDDSLCQCFENIIIDEHGEHGLTKEVTSSIQEISATPEHDGVVLCFGDGSRFKLVIKEVI